MLAINSRKIDHPYPYPYPLLSSPSVDILFVDILGKLYCIPAMSVTRSRRIDTFRALSTPQPALSRFLFTTPTKRYGALHCAKVFDIDSSSILETCAKSNTVYAFITTRKTSHNDKKHQSKCPKGGLEPGRRKRT